MKRNLPFYLIAAWGVLYAILVFGKEFMPQSLGSGWPQRAGVVVGGVLLSLTILLALVASIRGEYRQRNAGALAVAVVLHIGSTGLYLLASTMAAEVGRPFRSGITLEKLTERALNSPVARGRELAARYAFTEFGRRLPYADASGIVHDFEPNPVDLEKRETSLQIEHDMAGAQAVLRHLAVDFRAAALANLVSLAAVLLAGAVVLGGPKRWHGWLTGRSS
jgi:hypothetical protein